MLLSCWGGGESLIPGRDAVALFVPSTPDIDAYIYERLQYHGDGSITNSLKTPTGCRAARAISIPLTR